MKKTLTTILLVGVFSWAFEAVAFNQGNYDSFKQKDQKNEPTFIQEDYNQLIKDKHCRYGARLGGANLSGRKDLSGVEFVHVCLTGADLSHSNLTRTVFLGCDLTNANLAGADFTGAVIEDTHLDNVNATKATFKGTNITVSHLKNAKLHRANFQQANLTATEITNAIFNGADLTGADLTEIQGDNATFVGAITTGITGININKINTQQHKQNAQ